jgi:hypothetical protein
MLENNNPAVTVDGFIEMYGQMVDKAMLKRHNSM